MSFNRVLIGTSQEQQFFRRYMYLHIFDSSIPISWKVKFLDQKVKFLYQEVKFLDQKENLEIEILKNLTKVYKYQSYRILQKF